MSGQKKEYTRNLYYKNFIILMSNSVNPDKKSIENYTYNCFIYFILYISNFNKFLADCET